MANLAPIHNTIDRRAGAGVAGEITRRLKSTIGSVLLDQDTDTPDAFGIPVKMVAGLLRKFVVGDDPTLIRGALVRTEPAITELTGAPKENAIHSRVTEGFFNAVCAIGTPVMDQPVYVRTVADTGKLVGDLEATEASGENIAISGWFWAVAGKDASNIAEVEIRG